MKNTKVPSSSLPSEIAKPSNPTELTEAQQRVLAKMKAMTKTQAFSSLVSSGIYTSSGKLAHEYGG
jgi:hypothetical protein